MVLRDLKFLLTWVIRDESYVTPVRADEFHMYTIMALIFFRISRPQLP